MQLQGESLLSLALIVASFPSRLESHLEGLGPKTQHPSRAHHPGGCLVTTTATTTTTTTITTTTTTTTTTAATTTTTTTTAKIVDSRVIFRLNARPLHW